MQDLVEVGKVVLTALGTVAALGAFVGGTIYGFAKGWQKLKGNSNGNGRGGPFSKAAEHEWRATVVRLLGEIRDGVRDGNGDHRVIMARLDSIDRERTRP